MMNVKYIRHYLMNVIGSPVVVLYYGSRNKKKQYSGILYRVYNNIFAIKLDNGEIKCFSLIDILTKTIRLYI